MVGAAEREEAAEAEGLLNGQQTLREALEMELVRAAPLHIGARAAATFFAWRRYSSCTQPCLLCAASPADL